MVALLTGEHVAQGIKGQRKGKAKLKLPIGTLTLDQFAEQCVDVVIGRHRLHAAKREAHEQAKVATKNNRQFARKGKQ
jgi:hypothetical protein